MFLCSSDASEPSVHDTSVNKTFLADPYRHRTDIWTPGTRRRMCCRSPCEAPGVPALRAPRGLSGVRLRRWDSARPPTIRSVRAAPTAAQGKSSLTVTKRRNKTTYANLEPNRILIANWISGSSQETISASPDPPRHPNCAFVRGDVCVWGGDSAPLTARFRG